jgi:sulfide dehydrogenase cytochrome subunit
MVSTSSIQSGIFQFIIASLKRNIYMKNIATCIFILSAPFITASAMADSLTDKCDNCHGKDGISEHKEVPTIAGNAAYYIKDTFEQYKSGDRAAVKFKPENGDETDMAEIAKNLSEEDIEKVASHYAGKSYTPHQQSVDEAMADEGMKVFDKRCDKCHAEGGSDPEDEAGLLLGQWKPYLEKQFEMFDSGDRDMPKKMKKKFEKLSAEDKANIIEYLARGK